MAAVLITGMSGTGKSTAVRGLAARGHAAVDTDADLWREWVTLPDGSRDWIWREAAVRELLTAPRGGHLFVAGCVSNQGRFYPLFDQVVLLSAPGPVLLERVAARTGNPYGKSAAERAEILGYLATVEPLLRATATAEIDAVLPVADVVRRLEELADDGV